MKKPKKPPEKQFLESFRAHLKIAKSRGLFTKEAIEQNLGKGRACPFYTCSSKASYENIVKFLWMSKTYYKASHYFQYNQSKDLRLKLLKILKDEWRNL
jgi:hypothetical protein